MGAVPGRVGPGVAVATVVVVVATVVVVVATVVAVVVVAVATVVVAALRPGAWCRRGGWFLVTSVVGQQRHDDVVPIVEQRT